VKLIYVVDVCVVHGATKRERDDILPGHHTGRRYTKNKHHICRLQESNTKTKKDEEKLFVLFELKNAWKVKLREREDS
jgi:hypothetical protein